ncbi:hypothetical protein CCM_03772 [Cordyceps militaris CM01]|uniref:Uncharacterized protein n=1 Tax=Cordyceps militaris (strain CM01) TaxID=983644 RepID=G3JGI2_CORMM|nr:uncharacterized protein CCM_03772 [Cordyceps militaris CM01]EGX92399.1 hypothetical protein CCM_03772 [Cordyceps militaris CM01]
MNDVKGPLEGGILPKHRTTALDTTMTGAHRGSARKRLHLCAIVRNQTSGTQTQDPSLGWERGEWLALHATSAVGFATSQACAARKESPQAVSRKPELVELWLGIRMHGFATRHAADARLYAQCTSVSIHFYFGSATLVLLLTTTAKDDEASQKSDRSTSPQ